MISAKKALIARPEPIRPVFPQLGFELLDDAVKQTRRERIGHFPLQMPIARDPELLLSQLVLCHRTGPPTNRRAGRQVVSLKFSDHSSWFLIG
ncbi:hypothetical protein [Bradyrhizobium sp. Leaf401]|jgi:hypothetical protein|uniref:hypothetical protein n=1 Tax=Bradyrhizobium sp. Leaf401 TaxID=2876564 RepID=UPI001E2BE1BA|nr:hypothetical protein [Bradyrhizobium sp. Leaf401]